MKSSTISSCWLLVAVVLFAGCSRSFAATGSFVFRTFANGDVIDGQTSGAVTDGPFQILLDATPAGGVFKVRNSGVGVNSSGIANVSDGDIDKINFTGGSNPSASGISETITFSFNRDGVLKNLFLDGIKDENLEYAILTLPDTSVISIFDFEVPLRLAEQGFDLSDLTAPNIVLGSGGGNDDNALGLNVPFLSGQTFSLSFAVAPAPQRTEGSETITYVPNDPQTPNGYRLEAITVIPEPSTLALAVGCYVLLAGRPSDRNLPWSR